jgi:hypothetical protein
MARARKLYWFEDAGKCPYCKKRFLFRVKREVSEPGVKAVIKLTSFIEKDDQKELLP